MIPVLVEVEVEVRKLLDVAAGSREAVEARSFACDNDRGRTVLSIVNECFAVIYTQIAEV